MLKGSKIPFNICKCSLRHSFSFFKLGFRTETFVSLMNARRLEIGEMIANAVITMVASMAKSCML